MQRVKRHSEQVQHLRLAITPMLGPSLITPIMKMFHEMQQRFPGGDFEIFECRLNDIPGRLMDGTAEFAMVNLDESHFLDFQRLPLYQLPIRAYMSRRNPLAALAPLRFDQIKDEPLITSTVTSVVRKTIDNWFAAHGCTPKFKQHFSQMSTIQELVKNDMGIILSHCNIGGEGTEIVSVPLEECVEISVGLLWNGEQAMSNFAMQMVERLKKIKLS
ncbi:MAG: LysR family transcriptional regulator substrate-binding protein [Ruthenibacterium sp.]